jgi:serine protease Do
MKRFTMGMAALAAVFAAHSASAQVANAPYAYYFNTGAGAGYAGGSFLGVAVAEIDGDRARTLNLKEAYGVEITRIEDGSAADKAGLKVGDVLLEFNGQRVEGIEQFQRLVHETPAGRQVKLLISRNGASQTLSANMGAHKVQVFAGDAKDWFPSGAFVMPEINIPDIQVFGNMQPTRLGVETEPLNAQLADYFGVKDGVLIRAIVKGTAAEKAGLKAGDVITKVDQTPVSNPGEVSSAVHSARSKPTYTVDLVRDRKEMSVSIDNSSANQSAPPRARVVRSITQ